MNLQITRNIRDDLIYLKKYLEEKLRNCRKSEAVAINRFNRKFLNREIERLSSNPETYEEEISIPDELIRQVSAQVGIDVLTPGSKEISGTVTSTSPFIVPVPKYTHKVMNGNGHKKEAIRKLSDSEKDAIRAFFMSVDGQIEEDACVDLKKNMADDIAIFQVTGFVSYLHAEVASGKIKLRDIEAYVEWMKAKYPSMLERYNSLKYQKLRQHNQVFTATVL